MSSSNNKNKNGPPSVGSWIFTIIMLTAFWPVGIFMLIGNIRDAMRYGGDWIDKNSNATNKTQQSKTNRQAGSSRSSATYNPVETAKYAGTGTPQASASPRGAEKKTAPKKPEQSISARAFARLKKEQSSTNSISTVILIAAIIGFVAGGAGLLNAVTELSSGAATLTDFIMGGFFALGGAALMLVRGILPKRVKLRRRYLAYLGDKATVALQDFSTALARSEEKVQNDLQEMIDDGYFGPNAYIDESLRMLILDSSAAEAVRSKTASPKSEVADETPISEYDRILRELRSVNDKIADASISYKIDRIESTCAKIFRAVEENPEKLPQIRRFMSYYLPTTLKLLRSYATLERQGISGDNIVTTKESINNVLGKLVSGFDQQLDQLFRADAMDIGADIEVLQNMMAQDGLTDSGPMAQTSTGEFGYLEIK